MAPLSANPDRDFSAGRGQKPDFGDWRSEYVPFLEELFQEPDIQKRIGKLIANHAHPLI